MIKINKLKKERKIMKRQILQNVISFEKPKTVLVDVTYDYGNNKKVQAVDVRSLGGI